VLPRSFITGGTQLEVISGALVIGRVSKELFSQLAGGGAGGCTSIMRRSRPA
jgi:hypothetical protein